MTQPVTPEQEEQVRRALAAAARAEDAETPATMPPAVAARLDGVLAELVQSRSTTQAASPAPGRGPDELAAHRARRRLNVLVAAAALAVIAAAGGAVVTGGLGGAGGSSDGGAASSDSRASGLADDQVSQPEAAAPTAPSGSVRRPCSSVCRGCARARWPPTCAAWSARALSRTSPRTPGSSPSDRTGPLATGRPCRAAPTWSPYAWTASRPPW